MKRYISIGVKELDAKDQNDGPTTGPRSYSGPIGKLLKSDQLHLTPLNHHFTPLHLADIPPLSPEVKEKMSTDAVLLHDLSQYVNTGIPGSDNLAQRKTGAVLQRRPAEGTTEESSDELLQRSPRQHPGWNGDDPVRREGAVMMILKIRDLPTIGGIREYILPKLFFKSSSFKSMIKFHNETGRRPTYTAWNGKKLPVTEPPLLMKKTRDELLSYVDTPFSSDYPSHTQRVETGVNLTTAGAARVVGQKRQVGECLMVEASRKKSPGRVTRKRFNI